MDISLGEVNEHVQTYMINTEVYQIHKPRVPQNHNAWIEREASNEHIGGDK